MLAERSMPPAGLKVVFLVLCLLVSGCAREPEETPLDTVGGGPDLAALERRVADRWRHMVAKDFESVWDFETPAYRKNFPKDLYLGNFSYAVNWELTGIEIVNYDADAAVASVAVRVMSEPAKRTSTASTELGALPVTFHEKWLFIDGEWWFSANK